MVDPKPKDWPEPKQKDWPEPETEERFKPGQIVPQSGQYLNERTGTEVTCVRGKRFPPGPLGTTYTLSSATRHKGD